MTELEKKRIKAFKNAPRVEHMTDEVYSGERHDTKGFGTKHPRNKTALDVYEERQRREEDELE